MMNRGMVLITGCSGFIGKALAKKCLSEGWSVRGTIRSDLNSRDLPGGVESVIVQDVGPKTNWSEALDAATAIVHLAARVHASSNSDRHFDSIEKYFRINLAGTANLARSAASAGVRRMVFLSTIKVHGESRKKPYSEKDCEAPQGPYAVSKHAAENALKEVSKQSQLETVVLRPPLVYGPGVGANFLRLIQLVERRVPMPFASVSNRRSMIFVENLVDAVLTCLRQPEAAGKTYLVADDESPSTPELITQIAGFLDVPVKLFSLPPSVMRRAAAFFGKQKEANRLLGSLVADTSKIQKEIGWRPKFLQREGLRTTVEWYLRQRRR